MTEHPSVTVAEFVADAPAQLGLRVINGAAGAGTRRLDAARIQKLGLALAGFTHYIHPGRIQLIGQSEVQFLSQLTPEGRREAVGNLELEKISCILITKGLLPPSELSEVAERAALPIVQSPLITSTAIAVITEYLQEVLAPRERRHGVLLEIHGLGVLIEGESGIGKSECALDLLMRGHRLVADDVVEVWRAGPGTLRGSAPELLREHMEIRGLGILNVRELFGVTAMSGPVAVGLSISLERWHDAGEVERLGLDAARVEILGVEVPRVIIPVSPGRNLSTLVEAAVRVHLLRVRGYNAAREFVARHSAAIGDGDKQEGRGADTGAEHPG